MAQRNAHAVDRDGVAVGDRFMFPAAVDGVEIQQVGEGGRIAAGVVDADEVDVGIAPCGAQRETSHAAEAVDAGADGHAEWSGSLTGMMVGAQTEAPVAVAGAQTAGLPPQQ